MLCWVRSLPGTGTVLGTVASCALVIFTLVAIVCLPLQRGSYAASNASAYELRVRPRVCVTLASDSNCIMQLLVSWSAPVAADVCLKLQQADSMLRCWQQQSAGEFELALQLENNAIVQLLDSMTNAILSEAEVTLVSRDLRDSRRRRRHVWSII